jgi:hypothetical protein
MIRSSGLLVCVPFIPGEFLREEILPALDRPSSFSTGATPIQR